MYLTNPRQVDPVVAGGCSPVTRTEVDANGVMMVSSVLCSYKGDPDTYDLTTSSASGTVVINQVVAGRQASRGRGGSPRARQGPDCGGGTGSRAGRGEVVAAGDSARRGGYV